MISFGVKFGNRLLKFEYFFFYGSHVYIVINQEAIRYHIRKSFFYTSFLINIKLIEELKINSILKFKQFSGCFIFILKKNVFPLCNWKIEHLTPTPFTMAKFYIRTRINSIPIRKNRTDNRLVGQKVFLPNNAVISQ